MKDDNEGRKSQAKRPQEKRRMRGTVSSLGPSRAFLVRRERRKKRGKEGHPFAIEKGNGIYPKKKREEKVREKRETWRTESPKDHLTRSRETQLLKGKTETRPKRRITSPTLVSLIGQDSTDSETTDWLR